MKFMIFLADFIEKAKMIRGLCRWFIEPPVGVFHYEAKKRER